VAPFHHAHPARVAALGWSAFWFYSASQVDSASDAWRAREAKSGRVYDCAKRSVAGFPFRLEVPLRRRQRVALVADRDANAGHQQSSAKFLSWRRSMIRNC